jgi:hypothetical protein
VILSINFNSEPAPAEKLLKVNVSVNNQGNIAYSGARPEPQVLWGTFDVQWDRRSGKTFPLSTEWANLAPGQTLQTTVEIPLPEASGDYSVFALFSLFQKEKTDQLVGLGSVCSDSKLLRMPQPATRPTKAE